MAQNETPALADTMRGTRERKKGGKRENRGVAGRGETATTGGRKTHS